jgi:hypothetical protein
MRHPRLKVGNARRGSRSQPAPAPVLTRDASGQWTLAYAGPAQTYWLVWVRWNGDVEWTNSGELETSNFPAQDADMKPDDSAVWWQVKLCGEDGEGNPCTPFSNVVSVGLPQS